MIDETNLKMWGVVNFRDRKELMMEVKKLITSSQNLDVSADLKYQ